ncbi:MAG: VCBS repeat-containing protein [Flavobacteriales bacterium]|nr:VCBS repeat-containing protein [Flavobacteriales bacterium]
MKPLLILLGLTITCTSSAQFGSPATILQGLSAPHIQPPLDMDSDGDLDIVLQNDTGHFAYWLENDGLGNFTVADTFAFQLPSNSLMTMGDLFLDGYPDMVVNAYGSLLYRRNNGGGSWSLPASVPATFNATAITIAQVNGDSLPEILIGGDAPYDIHWFANAGFPPFQVADSIAIGGGPAPYQVHVVDMDQDGNTDLFRTTFGGYGRVARGLNTMGTQWSIAQVGAGFYAGRTRILDMDADGDLDVAKLDGGGLFWLQNQGNAQFPDYSLRSTNGQPYSDRSAVGELGCGAGAEFFWNTAIPQPFKWTSYSSALDDLQPPQDLELFGVGYAEQIELGDLNGDGLADVLIQYADSLYWLTNQMSLSQPAVSAPVLDTLCGGSGDFALPQGQPAGGSWWGASVLNDTVPANTIFNTTDTLVYTVADATGCINSATATLTHVSEAIVLGPLSTPVCPYPDTLAFTGVPSQGTWSGSVTAEGSVNPSATTSPISIIYTYTDPTGSQCVSTNLIQVLDLALATINPAGPFCESDTVQVLTAEVLPVGGTFSGPVTPIDVSLPNPITAAFDPAMGAGTYQVIVTSSPGPGQCPGFDTLSIEVYPAPVVSFAPNGPYCFNDSLVQLTGGQPAGGTYGGQGISPNGQFNPSTLGLGTHWATYSYADGQGCLGVDSILMEVTVCTALDTQAADASAILWDPVNSTVTLSNDAWSGADWTLLNATGGMLRSGRVMGRSVRPMASELALGVYCFVLKKGGNKKVLRLLP